VSTVLLQGSVGSIFVGQTGHQHIRSGPTNDEIPTKINCPECEPWLVRDFGGVYSEELIPPTDRQVKAREKAEKEGNAAVSEAAKALALSAKAAMQSNSDGDLDSRIAAAVAAAMSNQTPKRGRPRKAVTV